MYLLPPYFASLVFGWSLFLDRANLVAELTLGVVVDFAALATIFAGVLLVARYKGALTVAESAASSWKLERDAKAAEVERMVIEMAASAARIAVLEAQPSLSKMEDLLGRLLEVTKLHETNAELRRDSLVEVIREQR